MKKNINVPGDSAIINSGLTYTWYVNFSYGSIYHTTTGEFVDEEFGKNYTAVVINLPLDQRENYISKEQVWYVDMGVELSIRISFVQKLFHLNTFFNDAIPVREVVW